MTLRIEITKITFLITLIFMITQILPITVRLAQENDIDWVNQKYDEVKFQHSSTDDIIAIAELNDIAVGIGRLVPVDGTNYELGGMYVFEGYRNQKIATHIINFLLDRAPKKSTIFCIPFEHLSHFYQKFGFIKVNDFSIVPIKVASKYEWCKQTYHNPVDLLVKAH